MLEEANLPVLGISGPFRSRTPYDVELNIREAEALALRCLCLGIPTYCPHTANRFFDKYIPDKVVMVGIMAIIAKCSALAMVKGWERSEGSKAERAYALGHNMPVLYTMEEIEEWWGRVRMENNEYRLIINP